MSWRANWVSCASSIARSLGCHRISGTRDTDHSPGNRYGRISAVIILPAARAAIRRDHRIAEPGALARLRALQPDARVSRRIQLKAFRLAERARAAPPAALSGE